MHKFATLLDLPSLHFFYRKKKIKRNMLDECRDCKE